MKKLIYHLFLPLFLFAFLNCFSQTHEIDSLLRTLKTAKEDTNKVKLLSKIGRYYYVNFNFDTSLIYLNKALPISKKLDYKKGEAAILNIIGAIYSYKSDYEKALDNYTKAITIREKLGDKKGVAALYGNISILNNNQGNYFEAFKNENLALNIYKELNSKADMAGIYNAIGETNRMMGNYPEANKNYFLSLKIAEELSDKMMIGNEYNNIGIIYKILKKYDESLKYYNLAIDLVTKNDKDNVKSLSGTYHNIGAVYLDLGKYAEAKKYILLALKINTEIGNKYWMANNYTGLAQLADLQNDKKEVLKNMELALKIREEIGDKGGISEAYNSIGLIKTKLKQFAEARTYLKKSLSIAKEIHALKEIVDNYSTSTFLDSCTNDFKKAYEDHKLYVVYNDSLTNEENSKKMLEVQMQYKFDKKQIADSLKTVEERKLNEVKFEQEKKQRYFLYGGLVLVIIFAGFMFNRFKVTQKQKNIIEQKENETKKQNLIIANQKNIVEEKQKEILDSIHYAKRIQTALLGNEKQIEKIIKRLKN